MASMLENEDKLQGELYNAILKEDVEKVIKLCERFADHAMHRLTIHEDTVLHVATYSKQTGLVLRLLEALPHHHIHKITTSKNVSGNTVLHEVATLDDRSVEVATKILEKAPELLSMRNELGESVLFQSARYGKIKIFNFLADKISKYDEDTLKSLIQRNDKTTILHIAILTRQFGLAQNIARRFRHIIGEEDQDGMTALQLLSCIPSAFEPVRRSGSHVTNFSNVKRRPKLKSRYKDRVEKAIEYSQTIENWENLVDLRTLAFYNLGLDLSPYVLRSIDIEGKKKMTTKFNKGMYEKMRSKKDEPLSNIGKKVVRVKGKVSSVTPAASATPVVSGAETTRTASPATSVEEIPTPASKRPRTSDRGKDDVCSSMEDLKVFSGLPPNELMGRHLHKLVQVLGETIHLSLEYLAQGAKVESSLSRIKVLETENSKLKKDLIASMKDVHHAREEVKKLNDELKVE